MRPTRVSQVVIGPPRSAELRMSKVSGRSAIERFFAMASSPNASNRTVVPPVSWNAGSSKLTSVGPAPMRPPIWSRVPGTRETTPAENKIVPCAASRLPRLSRSIQKPSVASVRPIESDGPASVET